MKGERTAALTPAGTRDSGAPSPLGPGAIGAQPPRRPLQGAWEVLRFNWDRYAVAGAASAAGVALLAFAPLPAAVRIAVAAGLGAILFWSGASLAASHWVYDRAGLASGAWLAGLGAPRTWLNLHHGFDQASPFLRARFGAEGGRSLDVFDAAEMSEASIERARRGTAGGDESADFRALPLPAGAVEAAFLVFTAHELRRAEARAALFREVARVLAPGGRLVVVEHLRDLPNFLAFGPGFLHFLPRGAYLAASREGGLEVEEVLPFTPLVRRFVLRRTPCSSCT